MDYLRLALKVQRLLKRAKALLPTPGAALLNDRFVSVASVASLPESVFVHTLVRQGGYTALIVVTKDPDVQDRPD